MMTGVSVEDLQDAILCLSAEMDDMECRFRTICGAYARSEIVWTHAKKALQADVQDLKRTQTEMMQVVKTTKMIKYIELNEESVKCHRYMVQIGSSIGIYVLK